VIRWQNKLTGVAIAAILIVGRGAPAFAGPADHKKLDRILNDRAGTPGRSQVIVILRPGGNLPLDAALLGGKPGRRLGLINGQVLDLPNVALPVLANHPSVSSIHFDRPTAGEMNRVAVTVGARAAQTDFGFKGAGVGVAVIDSGLTAYHDDLTYSGTSKVVKSSGQQRTVGFVDFVNGRTTPYDDNGHGTHVAGIIAGNGYDSHGARAGIAPETHLVGLKVLDSQGRGVVSNVIAALDWILANKAAYNIRVANLSVGAAVTESYNTDPLALAARRVVSSGVVVVTAAGNLGKNALGQPQYGAITAPGNAPWVLTVGAYSHQGTVERTDDVMALYSSRGPTAIDFQAKPDVVAPGTGVVSLSDPNSLLYLTMSEYLLKGSFTTGTLPYLSLTGTSMSAPVVAGTVALMLQANPSLTPNMVKAIIQYTAQEYPGYNALTQGAGFLNSYGAVRLARFFATAQPGSTLTMASTWSRRVIWGNHRITGGVIRPNANAFQADTVWGAARDADGDNIVWGTLQRAADGDNIVWGTFDALTEDNIVWGTVRDDVGDNIVWGTFADTDNIVWGTFADDDNIVWGTRESDNIVWGTDCGGGDCDNIVWGTAAAGGDNIVWGTADLGDNIVWGTRGDIDNIVWGTSAGGTWSTSGSDRTLFDDPFADPVNYDQTVWDNLFVTQTTSNIEGGF
jgi:serine protease AprX